MERKIPLWEIGNIAPTIFCLDPLLRVVMTRHLRYLATVFVTYSCLVWNGGIRVLGPSELRRSG
jgi:hypothetical protein